MIFYIRALMVGCTYICFTLEALHCYNVNYNTILDKKTVTTDVYFYGDIVSLSTGSEEIKMPSEGEEKTETTRYDYFNIKTTGGYSFSIALKDKKKAMSSINAMKSMIHERKK